MNRSLVLFLTPLAPILIGLLALVATTDPSSPLAILLYAIASLLSIVLALGVERVAFKRNYLQGPVVFYLLGIFNLGVITSIIVEVLALFDLLDLIAPQLAPQSIWYVWALPSVVIATQSLILLERRVNTPRPALRGPLFLVAAVITVFDLGLWLNALLIETTPFLFITGIGLAPDRAVYLLLTATTLQAVTAMILFRVPTLFELIFMRPFGPGRLRALTSASPMIFTLAFTGLTLVIALIGVVLANQVFNLGEVLPGGLALQVGLALPIAVIAFFVIAGTLTYRRARGGYRHKMDAQQKVLIALVAVTGVLSLALLGLAWALFRGDTVTLAGRTLTRSWYPEALVLGILMAAGPVGYHLQQRQRRIQLLEERLSDFLTDMAETSKAGVPLHLTLDSAARKDYGPLTAEIRRMSVQCSWGLSFSEAFHRFGARTNSRLVRRVANLVVETSRSGGNTSEVLAATAHDIHEQKTLEEDRRLAMSTYIAVIYIVFFVFAAVLAVLAALFLPRLLGATTAAAQAGAAPTLFSGSRINLSEIKEAYFHALLVQGIGNGFVAGLVRDSHVSTGLRHVVILVLVSYLTYRFIFV